MLEEIFDKRSPSFEKQRQKPSLKPQTSVLGYECTEPYFESKFTIPLEYREGVLCRLRHYFISQTRYSKGTNRTVYFDTEDLRSFWQGMDGNTFKKKLRVRLYQDPIEGKSFAFEIKDRLGIKVRKERIRLVGSMDTWWKDVAQWKEKLELKKYPKFSLFSSELLYARPKIVIQYDRYRFESIDKTMRLNLDTEIHSLGYFLSSGLWVPQPVRLPYLVLEIKGNEQPQIPKSLEECCHRRVAHSKYTGLMRSYLKVL